MKLFSYSEINCKICKHLHLKKQKNIKRQSEKKTCQIIIIAFFLFYVFHAKNMENAYFYQFLECAERRPWSIYTTTILWAIAERSRACICSGFVVGVPGSNPTWGCIFLNKKKIRFSEVGWCVEQIVKKVTMGNESSISLGGTIILLAHFAKNNILSRLVISGVRYKGTLCWSNKMRL